MRILITNDDGVYAPGLAALHRALAARHQVMVVAPESEQSAVGHAITLSDPIRVRPLGPRTGFSGYAISGTPADCVKLAVNELMKPGPELVVSGINLGANLGVNLLYSGTVSAATEAAILGFTGLAFSLDTLKDPDFSLAARFAAHLVDELPRLNLPRRIALNVNVPHRPRREIRGVRFTRQSTARIREDYIRRTDPRGHVYYWLGGETMACRGGPESDYPALKQGYITITPLHFELTCRQTLEGLAGVSLELPPD